MEFIIGGFCQGKLDYVLQRSKKTKQEVFFGETDPLERLYEKQFCIVKDFHCLIFRWMKEEKNLDEEMNKLLLAEKESIISNEIGYGIVPTDPLDRFYREQTGRMSCILAKEAKCVIRVTCGIGTIIKP